VTQSEYLFEVNLPTSYRAQNTLLASIGATLDDRRDLDLGQLRLDQLCGQAAMDL
jgi:hypothetical protein